MISMTNNVKKRIDYWDIIKGISILLVILGHQNRPLLLAAFIFSFHMPIFFVTNAYFIREYNTLRVIKKSAKTLLLPYCCGQAFL